MRKFLYGFVFIAFALLFLFLLVYLFGTVDIRTEEAINKPNPNKGVALLKRAAITHGLENWNKWETVKIRWTDEFAAIPAALASPYKERKISSWLSFTPGKWDSQLEFLDGSLKGQTWGMQSWKTYKGAEENAKFEQDAKLEFWLPTYQYFVELPSRIFEADVILYAGEKEIDSEMHDGVYATWKTPEVQRDIDQYVLWINKSSGMITQVDFTVRDHGNFISAAVKYLDYKEYDGLKIPTRMPVISPPLPGFAHEMRILEFLPNGIPLENLQPNKELIGAKGMK